jgi:linoleoyl-CoA desaturase
LEPWRDAVAIGALNQGVLLLAVALRPGWGMSALLGAALAVGLATGTLTVLHDAGHRMLSRSAWPNVLAVQLAVPAGLWVGQWTLKHRVHHKLSQVYPIDESTRSSSLLRLHREAPLRSIHRHQHVYAWGLYSLAWVGEVRSQLSYLRTGVIAGSATPDAARRMHSFLTEKLLWLLVLTPYVRALGFGRMAVILTVAMSFGSLIAAVVVAVGHINLGLVAEPGLPGARWTEHLIRTTASFSTGSRLTRWWTGGMTHHLAHHLRPGASRSQLPTLHATTVRQLVTDTGLPLSEYPTFRAAVLAHHHRLRELGTEPLDDASNSHPGLVGATLGRPA